MKEHIYREYVQSVPQLAKLLPKDGEKSDGKDLLKKASADQFAAVGLIWSFIRCCIDSLDEYVSLRQRIYGEPKDPDALSGVERSEEHTSELQSRGHLVCRLLLEKKNNYERI